MRDHDLSLTIAKTLDELERADSLVITSSNSKTIVDRIADSVLEVVPKTDLSFEELQGVRALISHAVSDKRFFDWEMPTLTGFTAAEFRAIAKKLPQG